MQVLCFLYKINVAVVLKSVITQPLKAEGFFLAAGMLQMSSTALQAHELNAMCQERRVAAIVRSTFEVFRGTPG
jgi:hypothetical protein